MAQFKQYKLGFDRMFFINNLSDEAAEVQQAAIDAQQAAIAAIRPGISVNGRLGGISGDSVVVTAGGCEYITEYPRTISTIAR